MPGAGAADVRRDKPVQAAPRALDEAGQRRLLRAAEGAPIRARSLVVLMLFTALRISETVALDVEDVRIMTRKGVLAVMGKGEIQRDVPLNALVRQVLDEWLEEGDALAREGEPALWVSRFGGRLSARSADRDVRAVSTPRACPGSRCHISTPTRVDPDRPAHARTPRVAYIPRCEATRSERAIKARTVVSRRHSRTLYSGLLRAYVRENAHS
jgi:integrase